MSIADKLIQIAENEQKVFDAGKKAEYDHFWDVFQQNGERTNYDSAFYGFRSSGNFYPKYDITPTGNANRMMQYFGISDSEPIDLAARLEECGVKLDTSKATNLLQAFYWRLGVTRLPEISLVSATNTSLVITNNLLLRTIDKVIFSDDGNQPSASSCLSANEKLVNVTVEGVIGKSINLAQSHSLSAESAISIIEHLKNYKGTDEEYTQKLTLSSYAWDRLEAHSTAPDGSTWREYVKNALGWSV